MLESLTNGNEYERMNMKVADGVRRAIQLFAMSSTAIPLLPRILVKPCSR